MLTIIVTKVGEGTVLAQRKWSEAQLRTDPKIIDKISGILKHLFCNRGATVAVWYFTTATNKFNVSCRSTVIACPCFQGSLPQLLLWWPLVLGEGGVSIVNAESLERGSKIQVVIFDKPAL